MTDYNYNEQNIFTGIIDKNGKIFEMRAGRDKRLIGIDEEREQELLNQISEMQSLLDEYRDKLIELGVITIPKTPEEIALEQSAEQAEINKNLMAAIKELTETVSSLKGGKSDEYSTVNTKSGFRENGGNCKGNGAPGTRNTKSNANSNKNDTGDTGKPK